jgi:hypothetical protein
MLRAYRPGGHVFGRWCTRFDFSQSHGCRHCRCAASQGFGNALLAIRAPKEVFGGEGRIVFLPAVDVGL